MKRVERMIAVLVDARVPGSSGWAAVRSSERLKVKGLGCGQMVIEFLGNGKRISSWNVFEDIDWPIPIGADRVRVKLLAVDKRSKVFVDME